MARSGVLIILGLALLIGGTLPLGRTLNWFSQVYYSKNWTGEILLRLSGALMLIGFFLPQASWGLEGRVWVLLASVVCLVVGMLAGLTGHAR